MNFLKSKLADEFRIAALVSTVTWLLTSVVATDEYPFLKAPSAHVVRAFCAYYESLGLEYLLTGRSEPATYALRSGRILRELYAYLSRASQPEPKARTPPRNRLLDN